MLLEIKRRINIYFLEIKRSNRNLTEELIIYVLGNQKKNKYIYSWKSKEVIVI
jgi:hypothetical protein